MADYVQKLRDDLVEQFKGKPVIDALMEAVGDELNEVRQFYEDLRDKRNIQTAVGKQLDGIGDNAVLTRLEAGALACAKESVYVLDDDAYRTYLIYKIWKNTNNCTYYDIIRAFKMFWDKPLHYREDPAIPATMIYFYPRPPRGGRQQKQRQNLYFQTNYTTFCTNLEEP